MPPNTEPRYPARVMSPDEVLDVKAETLPDEVYIAVNGLIAESLSGQYANVTITALRKRLRDMGLSTKEVRERSWDQVGAVYKKAGWDVSVHYPGEDSNDFAPYYSFKTQGQRSW
jgi:hypothetical protein